MLEMISAAENLVSFDPSVDEALSFLSTLRNYVCLIYYLEVSVAQALSKMATVWPASSVSQFFLSQAMTFRDWISRQRGSLVRGSFISGMGAGWTIYNCEQFLLECERALRGSIRSESWWDSFTLVYIILGKSYADLGDLDSLTGTLSWCREKLFGGFKDMGRKNDQFFVEYFEVCRFLAQVCTFSETLLLIYRCAWRRQSQKSSDCWSTTVKICLIPCGKSWLKWYDHTV